MRISRIGRMKHVRVTPMLSVAVIAAVVAALSAQNTQRRVSAIVTGGMVVTVDGAGRVYNPGAVAIDGANIVAVGPLADVAARFTSAEQIHAAGSVIIPGLIN